MPITETQYAENVTVDINGNVIHSEIISEEVELPTQEEIIADKEAQLLEMYNELQALKEQQQTN